MQRRFDPLRELFAAKLESGEDLGASLALNIDGEMVVDLRNRAAFRQGTRCDCTERTPDARRPHQQIDREQDPSEPRLFG